MTKVSKKSLLSFNERVWELTNKVPEGQVTTYAAIAHALGCRAYRAVGNALNKSPQMPHVACHRVVNSDGRVGGFGGRIETKISRLKREGVYVEDGKIKEFEQKVVRELT